MLVNCTIHKLSGIIKNIYLFIQIRNKLVKLDTTGKKNSWKREDENRRDLRTRLQNEICAMEVECSCFREGHRCKVLAGFT